MSKVKKKAPPPITSVSEEQLCTITVVQLMVQIHDSVGTKQSHAMNFVVANIAHFDIILNMAWLQKQDPIFHWDTGVWHWRTHTAAKDRLIRLVSADAFVTMMHAERTHGYELCLYELGLNPDCNTVGEVFMPTGPEPNVPEPYRPYIQIFPKADSESVPSHSPQDLAIELLDGKLLL